MALPVMLPMTFFEALNGAHFALSDILRRAQANALGALGLNAHECEHQVIHSGSHWRLRQYAAAATGPSLLIVAAPIKRPYIWDLCPQVSAVGYCLRQGLRVYLIEWVPPSDGDREAGLAEYVNEAIFACAEAVSDKADGRPPFLAGHSLGGTLAAIFCATQPHAAQGLILLSAPLCFAPASSAFRDSLVSILPPSFLKTDIVAGSLLSHASTMASPDTFLWSRWLDGALSAADPSALAIHNRVERWALDEAALPGKLVNEIVQWLYREDRLCRGTLPVGSKTVGPSSLRVPTLAIVNSADAIAPLGSVVPFIEGMPIEDKRVMECSREIGVSLQHLAILVGREARARVWPEIIAWIKDRS